MRRVGGDLVRYRHNLQGEVDGAALYRALARLEQDPNLAEVYRRLAATEERHASFWEEKLRQGGRPVSRIGPSWRARVLVWLAERFGRGTLLSTLAAEEQAGQFMYDEQPEAAGTSLPADERSHARLLRQISQESPGGLAGVAVARLEGRHRAVGGNALRAAVLGVNDGLVSNLSLVMGVAGAALSNRVVLWSGLAGLLAGAFSMALGEWLSVQSSRELYRRQIDIEAAEIAEFPEEEEEELTLIYRAKGLPEGQARHLSSRILADDQVALDTMAREELGVDPQLLGGSAWVAAGTSFLLFALGAIVPVAPYLFLEAGRAVAVSLMVSGLALFLVGAGITLVTGKSLWFSGLRQLLFGLAAAALTFGIGRLLGVAVIG